MQYHRSTAVRLCWKTCCATLAALCLSVGTSPASRADSDNDHKGNGRMRINAGTAFNLHPVFDEKKNPVYPWLHEVRGVAQVSNLGNCVVRFQVSIDSGAACPGGHTYCLSGTMTLTTLDGDELQTAVTGWGDPDANDPKQSGSMNLLHYDVTITGGTGKLKGAKGLGEINGVFVFCGDDCFCDSYVGVATWLYDGVLQLPKKHSR